MFESWIKEKVYQGVDYGWGHIVCFVRGVTRKNLYSNKITIAEPNTTEHHGSKGDLLSSVNRRAGDANVLFSELWQLKRDTHHYDRYGSASSYCSNLIDNNAEKKPQPFKIQSKERGSSVSEGKSAVISDHECLALIDLKCHSRAKLPDDIANDHDA